MADDNKQDQPVEEVVETPVAEEPASEAAEETTPVEEAQPEATQESEPEPTTPAPAEEPAKELKKAAKPVSKDLEKIIEQIEKLSVLELADLVHALEDRFGVSATAPVAVASGAASSGAAGSGEPQEEKTTFNVVLTGGGANKIAVIKAVRELVPTLGLKEAKDLVEQSPKAVLEGVGKETAQEAKTKLTAAGGTVELQ